MLLGIFTAVLAGNNSMLSCRGDFWNSSIKCTRVTLVLSTRHLVYIHTHSQLNSQVSSL